MGYGFTEGHVGYCLFRRCVLLYSRFIRVNLNSFQFIYLFSFCSGETNRATVWRVPEAPSKPSAGAAASLKLERLFDLPHQSRVKRCLFVSFALFIVLFYFMFCVLLFQHFVECR
jgi:hypothetical protein